MQKRATDLMLESHALVPDTPTGRLFGDKPTMMDGHLVVFIARMRDVGRQSLIPEKLGKWADWAMQGEEWQEMMGGRTIQHYLLWFNRKDRCVGELVLFSEPHRL